MVAGVRNTLLLRLDHAAYGSLAARLERTLGFFRTHPVVDQFLQEHRKQQLAPHFRFASLLLRGQSQAG